MTAPANITQSEIQRAIRAARAEAPHARVVIDHARRVVEIDLSPSPRAAIPASDSNPWEDGLDDAAA